MFIDQNVICQLSIPHNCFFLTVCFRKHLEHLEQKTSQHPITPRFKSEICTLFCCEKPSKTTPGTPCQVYAPTTCTTTRTRPVRPSSRGAIARAPFPTETALAPGTMRKQAGEVPRVLFFFLFLRCLEVPKTFKKKTTAPAR